MITIWPRNHYTNSASYSALGSGPAMTSRPIQSAQNFPSVLWLSLMRISALWQKRKPKTENPFILLLNSTTSDLLFFLSFDIWNEVVGTSIYTNRWGFKWRVHKTLWAYIEGRSTLIICIWVDINSKTIFPYPNLMIFRSILVLSKRGIQCHNYLLQKTCPKWNLALVANFNKRPCCESVSRRSLYTALNRVTFLWRSALRNREFLR